MVLLKASLFSCRGAIPIREHCALAGVHFGSTLAPLEVGSMAKCNTFEKFSAVLSPELAALNLNAQKESRVLTGLYALAQEAVENEQKRRGFIEQLKQLGPRLR